jgi:hypothetical protein
MNKRFNYFSRFSKKNFYNFLIRTNSLKSINLNNSYRFLKTSTKIFNDFNTQKINDTDILGWNERFNNYFTNLKLQQADKIYFYRWSTKRFIKIKKKYNTLLKPIVTKELKEYRTFKQFYYHNVFRANSDYVSRQLKYNVRLLHKSFKKTFFIKWLKNSELFTFQKTNPIYFTLSIKNLTTNSTNWYLQNFVNINDISFYKGFKLLYHYQLIYNFLSQNCNLLISEIVGLNKYTYNNQSILHVTNIFNKNRISMLTSLVASTRNVNPYKKHSNVKNILSNRGYNLGSLYLHNKALKHLKVLKNVVSLSQRFIFSLQIQQFKRKLREKTFSCFYHISPEEFFISSVMYVTTQTKYIPLHGLRINPSNKVFTPKRGLLNIAKTNLNDNLLELNCDNHLIDSFYQKTNKNLYNTLRGATSSLMTINHNNFKYNDSLSLFRYKSIESTINNDLSTLKSKTYLLFNDIRQISNLYNNPLLFKYFFWNKTNLNTKIEHILTTSVVNTALSDMSKFKFGTRNHFYRNSNLWPISTFKYTVKKRVLKLLHYNKFLPPLIMWYYDTLVKFMEFHSGKKVYINFNPFVEQWITYQDRALLSVFSTRVIGFQKILGHRIFVQEALLIFIMAIRYKDPTFLANWIKAMLYRLSFWKYRLIFRYLKYCMHYLFYDYFNELEFKGLKFTVNGKIGVAGNARTRTLFYAIGETSHSKLNNRVLSHFTTINSFTGVMGFRLTFYF